MKLKLVAAISLLAIPPLAHAQQSGQQSKPTKSDAQNVVQMITSDTSGDLTPCEASELSKVVDGYARSLQTVEFEERLSILERQLRNDKSHR